MTENVHSRCVGLPQEFLRTSGLMAAKQMVGFFDRSAITVNSRKHLAAIRLSSQDRSQQVKLPSLQEHRRRSHYQSRNFADGRKLEGTRLGRDW